MDFLTHLFALLLLARTVAPRAPWSAWLCVIVSGLFAELDTLSAWFGPRAYFLWHGGGLHSLVAALCFALAAALVYSFAASSAARAKISPRRVFVLAFVAALLHLGIDVAQSGGVALLWPFSSTRCALDWIHPRDLWPPLVFALALLFPELFEMVRSEIGMRQKRARGRAASIAVLSLFGLYLVVRGVLHTGAVAATAARDYAGEAVSHAAAFPNPYSPLSWNSVAETPSFIYVMRVHSGAVADADLDTSLRFPKPEPSQALDAARQTPAAELFLRHARFPKAAVEHTTNGWDVSLRDLRFVALRGDWHEVGAEIALDASGRVTATELIWFGQASRSR